MQINETVKKAALEAAHRSWYGNPSFDRAVLLAVEAAFEAAKGRPYVPADKYDWANHWRNK